MVLALFGIRLGFKRGAKRTVNAAENAANEATKARQFLTDTAWPDVQKTLDDLKDTVTFAASMMVLLIALCVVLYVGSKLRELISNTGIPTVLKTVVDWLCLLLFSVVFFTLVAAIIHLVSELELHHNIVVYIKEFWGI